MTAPAAPQAAPHPVVGFGQLLRIALFPSAIADVLVGLSVAHLGGVPLAPEVWLLIPASLGIYHGAMALNDWADRKVDAVERPERPIPSGVIPAGAALGTALFLMLGGVMWAAAAGPRAGMWMATVTVLAALYDLAGRGAVRGPLMLGLCRAGNLGAGLLAPVLVSGTEVLPRWFVGALMLCYGLHVVSLSCLGRLEDGEDERLGGGFPTACLRAAAITSGLMAVIPMSIAFLAPPPLDKVHAWLVVASVAVMAWFAVTNTRALWSAATRFAGEGWTRQSAGAGTGLVLRRLPFTLAGLATVASPGGPLGLAALLFCLGGGYVSKALRKRFPLT